VNIILIVVLIEHILMIIKIVIATVIPDVPESVQEAEKKRPTIMSLARAHLDEQSKKSSVQSLKEIQDELKRQAT
jgi:Calcium-activated chloride channel